MRDCERPNRHGDFRVFESVAIWARGIVVSPRQIRFATLWRREVNRFMKIKKQTLGAPLLETFLYITVFGAALGSRIKELHGIEYIIFVIPGLIMAGTRSAA